MAGQKVRCAQCGQKIALPGTPQTAEPPASPAAGAAPDPVARMAASVIPSAWGAEAPPGAVSSTYTCVMCGGQFGVGDVYDLNGSVVCKSCFQAQAAAPPAHAIACAACGTAVPPEEAQEVNGSPMCPTCAMAWAARVTQGAGRTQAAVRRQSGALPWAVGVTVAAAVVVGVVFLVRSRQNAAVAERSAPLQTTKRTSDTSAPGPLVSLVPATRPSAAMEWERANGPRLTELRAQAKALEAAGALAGASARYAEYFELAKGAPAPGEALAAQIADARSSWDAVKGKIAPPQQLSRSVGAGDSGSTSSTQPSGWEPAHRAQIEKLIASADAKLAGNDKFQAALAYQQVIDLVGEHLSDIQDPELKKKIGGALVARSRLLGQVKGSAQSVELTTNTLLSDGLAALGRNKYDAALDSLSDVKNLVERNTRVPDRMKNPQYLRTLEALAFAYLKTKLVPRAGELFDDSAPLSRQLAADPTRDQVINRSVTDMIQRTKAMRAAKTLREYLEKHPQDNDQEVLDLFGTALSIAAAHTQEQSFLKQCAEYYERRNEQLEKTRPGEKRWGVRWMSQYEAQLHFDEQRKAGEEWQKLVGQANAAYADWQKKQQDYIPHGPQRIRTASLDQVNQAEARYRELAAEAEAASKTVPMPPWLTTFDPVPPPGVEQTALAMVTPEPTGPEIPDAPPRTDTSASEAQAPEPPPSTVAPEPTPGRGHRNSALAFAVDKLRLVTAAEPVAGSTQVRLEDSQGLVLSARVVAREGKLALLEVSGGDVSGGRLPYFNLASAFGGGAVKCACIPQANIFGPQPALLAGEAAAPPQDGRWSASLADHPRLAGSPLLNANNEVVGIAVPTREDPRTKLPAVSLADLRAFLQSNNALPAAPSRNVDPMEVFQVTAVVN